MPSIIVPTTSGWQVLRRSVRFQGGRELFFEDLVFASKEPSLELDERMRGWRVRGIQDVFLLISDPDMERYTAGRLRAGGRSVTVLPATIDQMPPADLRQVNVHLLSRLARGNAVLLASRELAEQARILMTTLVMTPRGSSIAPGDAVKLVAGRGLFESLDRAVTAYYDFLHGTTSAPSKQKEATPKLKEVAAEPLPVESLPNESVASQATSGPAPDTTEPPAKKEASAPAAAPVAVSAKPAAVTPKPAAAPTKPEKPITEAAQTPQDAAIEKAQTDASREAAKPGSFKSSRFSIRVKLLGIISGIILSSLLTMILLASQFFKDDSETRIKENSLSLTEVIGLKVESELEDISYRAQLAATTLEDGDKSGAFTDLFLRNNQNFVFVGIGERDG
ncbi:MAG: hypothetical protein HY042_06210, partial [Spirochaetia bacterium]|nr:hypothetical protein [Spirochaetia bacterium]